MVIVYGVGIIAAGWFLLRKRQYRKSALIVMAGCMVALLLELSGMLLSGEKNLSGFQREEKDGRKQSVEVTAMVGDETKDFRLEIAPQAYTAEELEKLWQESVEKIEELLYPEDLSPDYVDRDLSLPDRIEGTPFMLQWESSNPLLISQEGCLGNDVKPSGEQVSLTVTGRVEDSSFAGSYQFDLNVFPKSTETAFFERLEVHITETEKESRTDAGYDLPEVFEGKQITWKKKESHTSASIFFVACIAAVLTVAGKKQEEEKKRKKRTEQLEREYPQLVSRTVMLMGAGMTVSGAFRKIAGDYKRRKNEKKQLIYEEVTITCHELDSGISEGNAYRNMGVRCRLPCYARFASLLIQCVKRGSGGCREALWEEASQSLRERKALAKRLGEEAGTKLLFPMILMLVFVMVIIMIPAFTTFT
ncbi:MAG: type II secretion system F family protein [Lachnospiraceae bacterium]|nr:type II secretion system F family protein [Lachnospiraceae bacterium]